MLSSTASLVDPTIVQFSNDTSVAISADIANTVSTSIEVSGVDGIVTDLQIAFDITHESTGHLTGVLIAPDGSTVKLFDRIGLWLPNFHGTVLDDAAETAIEDAGAPFTGTFRPMKELAALDGIDPNGTWTFQVIDRQAGRGGSLDNWSITITAEDISPSGQDENGVFYNKENFLIRSDVASTITSEIDVAGLNGLITDINVGVEITHESAGHLSGTLIAPDGTRITLFERTGLWLPDFTDTILDDQASESIQGANAPFTGSFQPKDLLEVLNGADPNGTWILEIVDHQPGRGGQLNEWTLDITTDDDGTPPPPPPTGETVTTGSNNTSVAISADSANTVSTSIEVSGVDGIVTDLQIAFDITHESTGHLTGVLIAPDGSTVKLFDRIGLWLPNFHGTVLDDAAETAIEDAGAPFTGTFRPMKELAALDGIDPNGTWTFQVIDRQAGRGGSLDNWSITITAEDISPSGQDENGVFYNKENFLIRSDVASTITSEIDVAGLNGLITDINVGVEITHESAGHLSGTLIAPDGTRITLFERTGLWLPDFTDTILDDQASESIQGANAPFTGSFQPKDLLEVLNGADPNGTWILEIVDHQPGRGGQLNEWTLDITTDDGTPPPPTGETGTIQFAAGVVQVGDALTINVTDPDLADAATLAVQVNSANDLETVVLSAIGNGQFSGQLATSAIAAISANGILSVTAGETVTATYVDTFDENGQSTNLTSTKAFAQTTATLSFDQTSYDAGDLLTITVNDIDLSGLGSLNVSLTSISDTETVTLQEISRGLFRGSIVSSDSTSSTNDSVFSVDSGETITASYLDPVSSTGQPLTVSRTATINVPPPPTGTNGTLSLSPTLLNVGGVLTVTLNDPDLAGQSQATVHLSTSLDSESLTLNAQGGGLFTRTIGTTAHTTSNHDGTLSVVADETITASYVDELDSTGGQQTRLTYANVRSHTGQISLNQSEYEAGDVVTVTLQDIDLTGLSSVQVQLNAGSDLEYLNLSSSGNGVFTGTIGSNNLAANSENGTLNFQNVISLTATYLDQNNASGNNQSIQATSTVTYVPPPVSEFEIVVRFTDSNLTASQQAIFAEAAARWSEIIIGDLPDAYTSIGIVDDIVIDASAPEIDGRGGILGSAGPREVRGGSLIPSYGVMRFDSADLVWLEAQGRLVDVIIHEMGHVLGIGTMWSGMGLVSGLGSSDPIFTGTQARIAYGNLLGTGPQDVPVENAGGSGTRDAHWRESVFGTELMTGYLNSGVANPISSVTVASLADMGYEVDMAAADFYTLPGSLTSSTSENGTGTGSESKSLHDDEDHDHEDEDHDHGFGIVFIPDYVIMPTVEEVSNMSPLALKQFGRTGTANLDEDWFSQFDSMSV
ncbi:Proprotein convertase P-domain protein [Thalassoglobus neptunius]|uniref:Proprotein convertase P-domain protein n=1 Tax=Thalassoglobus neptunius TaxID=1938619 RepID=A0A5C5VS65_9PLAN|nr:proprotein convertase P-domain-containing protein [Thalassoglobus neptunius]TWT41476.1 Proprotein convertase P-domain protein [Thalassoglobus neptunius]